MAATALADLAQRPQLARLTRFEAGPGKWTSTGTAVFPVGPPGGPPAAVLRVSASAAGALQQEGRALRALAATPGLAEVRDLLPTRRGEGTAGRWSYALDDHLPGVDATEALATRRDLRDPVRERSALAVTTLHRATAVAVRVDDALLERWVDEPVAALGTVLRRWPLRRSLTRLRHRLRADLDGRRAYAGWVHGDLWLGNVRVHPGTGAPTGLVDWDCAAPQELPAHDLLHLALFGSAVERGVDLGTVVAEVMHAGTWSPDSERVLRHARWCWDAGIPDSSVTLLYWLRHVTLMSAQQDAHVEHSLLVWRWRNVRAVLRCL